MKRNQHGVSSIHPVVYTGGAKDAPPIREMLALRVDTGRVTASDETYSHVVVDVEAIGMADPALADIGDRPHSDGKQLLIIPSELTIQSVRAGDCSAWNCLNEFYGLEAIEIGSSFVVVTVKGMYELGLLRELYRELPGI